MKKRILPFLLIFVLVAASAVFAQNLSLPEKLTGKAEVLKSDDPDYARASVSEAVKPEGMGGVSAALVVRLIQDIPVYRMWNGPDKKDARGNTNRLGSWWSYDSPAGSAIKYRADYEICRVWNDLAWMATCTLKKDAVVAIGPGQSVSATTCGDATGKEQYPINSIGWQVYVNKPWTRGSELACPPESSDYAVDPEDIAKPK